jgi:phage tail sheath gpL-like
METTVLTARALKIIAVLDPADVTALPDPGTAARVTLTVETDGNAPVTASVTARAIRKAQVDIGANVAGSIVHLTGKLVGTVITEAALTVHRSRQWAAPAPTPPDDPA